MILDLFKLDGKVAVITGASSGIGEGIAIAMAEAGADIVCVARRPCTKAVEYAKSIGRRAFDIQADLTSQAPIPGIVEKTVAELGRLDILVNNAGIIRRDDFLDFNEKDWDDVLNVNLKSLFFLSQAAAKQMVAQGSGGKIINTASMLSFQGGIRVPSYTASKSGVMGLTRLLACELAGKNINVNALAPGYIETDNTEALRNDPVRSKEILGRIPVGRWGSPADMAGAAVFLASDAANYITGYTLAVDGGWLAR